MFLAFGCTNYVTAVQRGPRSDAEISSPASSSTKAVALNYQNALEISSYLGFGRRISHRCWVIDNEFTQANCKKPLDNYIIIMESCGRSLNATWLWAEKGAN